MDTHVIQRQYNDIIAEHYDHDPQSVTGDSLDRALRQLQDEDVLNGVLPPLRVLDLGMGTGMFLKKLRSGSARAIEPFGIDVSEQMLAVARGKLPDLVSAVDDAANLDDHFCDEQFGLVSTHFVTGFVPLEHLAPRIHRKLAPGGYWSFVGGMSEGYRELQRRASTPLMRLLFGGRQPDLQGLKCPDNQFQVEQSLRAAGLEIVTSDTFEPSLQFRHLEDFMEYGYRGGWLTPFIEDVGLQRATRLQRAILNTLIFPVQDHHSIVITLARKPRS
jgi:hypothetical protein